MTPPEILKLQDCNLSFAVDRCVNALLSGKLLVLPTETVYGLGALASNAEAVARLCEEKERRSGHALPLAVSGFEMAKEFVTNLPPVAKRLAEKFWPGPLTLVVDASNSEGKLFSFSEGSLQSIMPQKTCGFRAPRNEFLLRVIQKAGVPLVLTSANISGRPAATNVQEALEALGDRVDLFVDGGPATYGKASTVAKLDGSQITILREGAVSLDQLRKAALKTIVFVCTANICRSPMAEALAKMILCEELHVAVNDLEAAGYRVLSGGVNAVESYPAAPFALQIMNDDYGLSLKKHRSQHINRETLESADLIFTMENAQKVVLQKSFPNCANKIETLSIDGSDVKDPYGRTEKEYRDCAMRIESLIRKRLTSIL